MVGEEGKKRQVRHRHEKGEVGKKIMRKNMRCDGGYKCSKRKRKTKGKKESLLGSVLFISVGEYIKLAEREKGLAVNAAHAGRLRQTSGLSESSEINGGWIIYTPSLLWEKCFCSLCIKVIEWAVLYGPFRGGKWASVQAGCSKTQQQ